MADRLVALAARLRELAENAQTGDGESLTGDWFAAPEWPSSPRYEVIAECEGTIITDRLDRHTATFIAALNPAFALVLADLINEVVADHPWDGDGGGGCISAVGCDCKTRARFLPLCDLFGISSTGEETD